MRKVKETNTGDLDGYVGSVGAKRLAIGIGFGGVREISWPMVVLWGLLRLTVPASESVPVFTDHRSLPQCCWASSCDAKTPIAIAKPSIVVNRTGDWHIVILLSSE